jgi:hypothetical protein
VQAVRGLCCVVTFAMRAVEEMVYPAFPLPWYRLSPWYAQIFPPSMLTQASLNEVLILRSSPPHSTRGHPDAATEFG